MKSDFIELATISELLCVTLFSMYCQVCFSTWMPFICNYPPWFHLIIQFMFIGLPQATIVVVPQYSKTLYLIFGFFGLFGLLCSYLRYNHVKKKVIDKGSSAGYANHFGFQIQSLQPLQEKLSDYFRTKPEYLEKRSNTISLYQTCIMMMTITAISAVDFKVFPSRFRKSKTFGLSLMDIGVSLIITASGLVMSKYLDGRAKLNFKKLVRSSAPLLLFGIIKGFMSAKYNIGAAEYGKHWNFFVNLALLPFTIYFANLLPSLHLIPLICSIWMLGYQYSLTALGYSAYVLTPANDSFFEQNKIGIFSLGGYSSLFLMSCYIGKLYSCPSEVRLKSTKLLAGSSIILWSIFLAIVNIILPSRSLANLTYVIWGLANGALHFTIMSAFDYFYPDDYRFILFAEMISEYRLSIFILANLLSTCIRRMFDIKSSSIIYTLKIVFAYLTVTCTIIAYSFLKKHVRLIKNDISVK